MDFIKVTTTQGVPLYCMEMPWAKSVATGVLVKAGTRDEIWPKEAGIAHALEHMLFQGTEEFPTSRDIWGHLEDIGGRPNAWTWKEMTFYHNYLPADKVERGIHILGQMLRKSFLREANIKTEMQNIIQEIRRANDDHRSYLSRRGDEIIYNGHVIGRDSHGTEEAVANFKSDDFREFMRRFYLPENFTFIVAGNVNTQEIKDLFESNFPEPAGILHNKRSAFSANLSSDKLFVIPRKIEQCHLIIGTLTCGAKNCDYWPLKLFETMIDGGASFPLFQEVRDKRGLAYSVSADCSFWSDTGDFSIYIGTDPARKDEAIRTALDVVKDNKNSEKLLERARELMLGRMALAQESSYNILQAAAYQLGKSGDVTSYDKKIELIKSVNIKQVEEVVEKYLSEDKMVTVMLMPEDLAK